MTPHTARRDAAACVTLAVEIEKHLPLVLRTLAELQPGYPTGGAGPGRRNDVSDPTGQLATGGAAADPVRQAQDELDLALAQAAGALMRARALVRTWRPPAGQWRDSLTDQATAALANNNDPWCQSCLRAARFVPPRTQGSRLCRWCSDMARTCGRDLPPLQLVERHAQGRRITDKDIERATGGQGPKV